MVALEDRVGQPNRTRHRDADGAAEVPGEIVKPAGIADEGKGGTWIDEGGMDKYNVNLSGGQLNGNPLLLGGAARAIECYYQLAGQAGERQVKGAKKAVAQAATGGAGQHQAVIVMEA